MKEAHQAEKSIYEKECKRAFHQFNKNRLNQATSSSAARVASKNKVAHGPLGNLNEIKRVKEDFYLKDRLEQIFETNTGTC